MSDVIKASIDATGKGTFTGLVSTGLLEIKSGDVIKASIDATGNGTLNELIISSSGTSGTITANIDNAGNGTFTGLVTTGPLEIKSGDDIKASIDATGKGTFTEVQTGLTCIQYQQLTISSGSTNLDVSTYNYIISLSTSNIEPIQILAPSNTTNFFDNYIVKWYVNITSDSISDNAKFEIHNMYISSTMLTFKRHDVTNDGLNAINIYIELIKKM